MCNFLCTRVFEEVQSFFSNERMFSKLSSVLQKHPDFEKIVDFHVTTSEHLITENNISVSVTDLYKRNVKVYKKRLFNFLDKEGRGSITHDGKTNPKIMLGNTEYHMKYGLIYLTLAKWNAFKFLIECNEFDYIVENFEDLKTTYMATLKQKKKVYIANHRSKIRKYRALAKEVILKEREESSASLNQKEKARLKMLTKKFRDETRVKNKKMV